MSLKKEIEQLQQQRKAELRTAQFQFARTRRDIRNALSPARIIRRHPGLAVGASTLAGVWLAPHLGRTSRKDPAATTKRGILGRITGFFTSHKSSVPPDVQPDQPARSHPLARSILRSAIPLLLTELDRNGILRNLLDRAIHGKTAAPRHNGRPAASPTVTAADAGVQPSDEPLGPIPPD